MYMTNKQKLAYCLYHLINWTGKAIGFTVIGLNWLVRNLITVPHKFYDAADSLNTWAKLGIPEAVEESIEESPADDIVEDVHLADVVNNDGEDLPPHLKKQAD